MSENHEPPENDATDEMVRLRAENDATDEMDRLRAENEALKSAMERRLKWRSILTVVLVVLTSLSVVASTFAVWARQSLFDTDAFMESIGPALDDPALYDALGSRVSAEVLDALDLEARVSARLTALDDYLSQALIDAIDPSDTARQLLSRFDRPSLADLAPPIAEGLEQRIDTRIYGFFTSEQFAARLPDLVRRSHEVTVALLRNNLAEVPNVYIADGEVRLNLIPLINEALAAVADELRALLPDFDLPDAVSGLVDEGREQLQAAIGARLPDDFGQLTILSEQALTDAQQTVERLDRYVWLLVTLSLILAAATIAISTTRRRTALQLALGVAIAIAVAATIMRRVEAAVLEQIVSPEGDVAAKALLGSVLTSLRRVELVVFVAALVVAIGAYLVGRPAWLSAITDRAQATTAGGLEASRLDRWVDQHFDLLRVAGIGVAVLVLFLVGWNLLPVVLIAGLLALYLWFLTATKQRVSVSEPEPTGDDAEIGSIG